MAGLGNKLKRTVLKSMEAVGQSASNLATNAQQKLQELNLETQRREILSAFPLQAYDLWQKGEKLPEALEKKLQELSDLDERLGVLRAQRYAQVEEAEKAVEKETSETESAEADEESQAQTEPVPASHEKSDGDQTIAADTVENDAPCEESQESHD